MSEKKIIIGLGTGRCGTVSLSTLLNKQEGVVVTHERVRLPWVVNKKRFSAFFDNLLKNPSPVVGDVSFYLLPYVDIILNGFDDVKFICLQRDKESTIKSYLGKVEPPRNNWQDIGVKDIWDECFPTYDKGLTKAQSIGKYWDDYYDASKEWQSKIPDKFKLFNTNDLNTDEGVSSILNFCELESSEIITKIRENVGK